MSHRNVRQPKLRARGVLGNRGDGCTITSMAPPRPRHRTGRKKVPTYVSLAHSIRPPLPPLLPSSKYLSRSQSHLSALTRAFRTSSRHSAAQHFAQPAPIASIPTLPYLFYLAQYLGRTDTIPTVPAYLVLCLLPLPEQPSSGPLTCLISCLTWVPTSTTLLSPG